MWTYFWCEETHVYLSATRKRQKTTDRTNLHFPCRCGAPRLVVRKPPRRDISFGFVLINSDWKPWPFFDGQDNRIACSVTRSLYNVPSAGTNGSTYFCQLMQFIQSSVATLPEKDSSRLHIGWAKAKWSGRSQICTKSRSGVRVCN